MQFISACFHLCWINIVNFVPSQPWKKSQQTKPLLLDTVQVDIPFKYLGFFLDDDAEMEHIREVTIHAFPQCFFAIKFAFVELQLLAFNSVMHGLPADDITNNTYLLNFQEYGSGRMLTGEIKKRLVEVLTDLVERHRRARAAVTDEVTDSGLSEFQITQSPC